MIGEFIGRTRLEAFKWGVNDCALWCASAVLHMEGVDPAEDLRGTYWSRFTCDQIIKRAGGLQRLIAPRMDALGLDPLGGDGVAIVKAGGRKMCGVIVKGAAVLRTEKGLRIENRFEIIEGWSWSRR